MIEMLVGAVLVIGPATVAWVAGRHSGRAAERRLRATAPALVCSCAHGFGTHDDGGACSGTTRHLLASRNYGQSEEWEWAPCRCHRYDGPEPLPSAWSLFPPFPPVPQLDERNP